MGKGRRQTRALRLPTVATIALPLFSLEVTVPLGDNGQSRTDVHGVAARCLTTWLRYHIWQAVKESNLYQRSQSPLYYRYTNGL